MKLACLLFASGMAVAGLTGCRTTHLGADTAGHAYRAAFAAQRAGDDTVEPPALDADDARQVLSVHRTGKPDKDTDSSSSTTMLVPTTLTSGGSSSGSSGGSWPGATGNISLEAK